MHYVVTSTICGDDALIATSGGCANQQMESIRKWDCYIPVLKPIIPKIVRFNWIELTNGREPSPGVKQR